ncbi:hypothetical protein HPC49_28955 [Pyxidicoccus fallax]|uniref:Lipoprotein n=1 Tax=Pyxidicoccus fallax TaxID=394095 RepID=A0A848LDV0_9BACT|nr:hypothetical protein [Pyxidicoccus fallax]NMO16574.1 hypothetical protein [Pyxidicoccus fallax]NPC82234.1 hypothetical protein [Pyxidicoccus fallax]
MLTRWRWFIAVAAACALPSAAQACSCERPSGDLHTQLRTARENAVAIYRARVTAVDPAAFDGKAAVEVLEVFKGPVKPGERLDLPSGGRGACTIAFKAGKEYLMYAQGKDATSVSLCSRTHSVTPGTESELAWLRTGKLPPLPVALQREAVSCEPCDIDLVGGRLIVAPDESPSSWLWPPQAAEAMKEGRPFFTRAHVDSEHSLIVGMSFDGKPFELTQTHEYAAPSACTRRIHLRWCKRLDVTTPAGSPHPVFKCIEPGESSLQCDESKGRESSWRPPESIPADACLWRTSDTALCTLEPRMRLLPAGARASPVLKCRPQDLDRRDRNHFCQVETKPGPTDKAP